MAGVGGAWAEAGRRNRIVRFVDISLRGAGQVIFQNNPVTGLLFIAGICWGAYAEGDIPVALGALIGVATSTATAILLGSDKPSLEQGLFGFNGLLVGAAIPAFIAPVPVMWLLLVIGAAVSTVAMLAISNVMKTWGVPALTFPFVLTTWFVLLAAYSFGHVPIASMGPPALPHPVPPSPTLPTATSLLESLLKGPAQVFLIDNSITGVVILIALLVNSARAALFALAGSAVALAFALLFGGASANIGAGLYAFSSVLTAVALGSVFYDTSWRVTLFALLGAIFTVVVQGAMDTALAPAGVPSLTAPFVFVAWLFLLPKASLQPHPHAPIRDGILTGK